jgi:two-component system chemotaxis response regulator CheB
MNILESERQSSRANVDPTVAGTHDIVAIGASAGGIQVLLDLVRALPDDFPAALLVVVHIGTRKSVLPQLLDRAGALPAAYAQQGEPILPGRIYLAPPDTHLLVEDGHMVLSSGPRENRFRPAIDTLFRSVAQDFGPRVVGIVLSGALTDGTVGLAAIKACGGVTIVQDPAEAIISAMPASALAEVNIDHVLTTAGIQDFLMSLDRSTNSLPAPATNPRPLEPSLATEIIEARLEAQSRDHRPTDGATMYTCPDCGGTLWQVDEGAVLRFQCHVGHGWSWNALLEQKSDQLESAIWATSRLFAERSVLRRQIAARSEQIAPDDASRTELERLAENDDAYASRLQEIVSEMAEKPLSVGVQ